MLVEYNRLTQQIELLKKQIQLLPDGNLVCCVNGNSYKWYQSQGNKRTYIPRKNLSLAEQLATKKYLTYQLEEAINNQKAIAYYLKHYQQSPSKADSLLIEHPEFARLLSSQLTPLSDELASWSKTSYEQNPAFPELLIHKSSSGHFVRSKSEALIDTFLYKNKIPFRYECALILDDHTLYPDFTIRHPRTGTIYYWEHFGRMDDLRYTQKTFHKLQTYTSHGIIPSIHLITTYETQKHPLSADTVEKIIEHYFL